MPEQGEPADVVLRDGAHIAVQLIDSTVTTVVLDGPRLTAVRRSGRAQTTTTLGPVITSVAFTPQDLGEGGIGGGTGGQGTVISGSIRYVQATPAATWSFTHPLGRPPQVSVYLLDDGVLEEVETDVAATNTEVVVSWPYPVRGELIVQ